MKREREEKDTITAVDYIKEQDDLERQARELMPYDPNECTYIKGPLRQPVFACLTCSRDNDHNPIGICYSCSIQCHSSHELVELFAKREFVCDCGTTKMAKTPSGACRIRTKIENNIDSRNDSTPTVRPRTGSMMRSNHSSWSSQSNLDLPAEDVPSSNSYNQNYKGLFCSCLKPYNPLEETGNMFQCYFGFDCGEDWFHESCILGYKTNVSGNDDLIKGENVLDKLPPPDDAAADNNQDNSSRNEEKSGTKGSIFPDLDDFDVFICWKCASKFKKAFEELEEYNIILCSLPHFDNVGCINDWRKMYDQFNGNTEPNTKKIKLEDNIDETEDKIKNYDSQDLSKSYFLKHSFRPALRKLKDTLSKNSPLHSFLINHPYIYMPDPVYEPPTEDGDDSSTSGSILEAGTEALHNLPRDQAIESIQAYDKIRSKLREFFKPFAEQGKVVTEEEVREFFNKQK